jgi:transposase
MTRRDALGVISPTALFADLSPQGGHSGAPPWRLALVPLRPCSANLTDRQAAAAGRGRLDWQYALGLALTATGFDFAVLSACRTRLLGGAAAARFLTTRLDRFTDRGLLQRRGPQRTDAPPMVAAVRALHRLAMVGEPLHAALHARAHVAPVGLRDHGTAAWCIRSGQSLSADPQPQGHGAR